MCNYDTGWMQATSLNFNIFMGKMMINYLILVFLVLFSEIIGLSLYSFFSDFSLCFFKKKSCDFSVEVKTMIYLKGIFSE